MTHHEPAVRLGESGAARTRQLYLDVLRIAAVLGVVLIHVFGGLVTNASLKFTPGWWGAAILNTGSIWVVPMFVLVSGALILREREQAAGPMVFYRRRLLRIGPAFVFWQIFYIVIVRMMISGQDLTLLSVAGMIASGNTYTHLYFLWLIVGLYLAAPVLYPFLAGGTRQRAIWLAGVLIAATSLAYSLATWQTHTGLPLTALTQWIPFVGLFVAGAALRDLALKSGALIILSVAGASALIAWILQNALLSSDSLLFVVSPVAYTAIVPSFIAIAIFLVVQGLFARRRFPMQAVRIAGELSDASFGVFLVHFVIMIVLTQIPGVAEARETSFWAAFALWVAVVVLSFAVTLVGRQVPVLRRIF